MDIIRFTTTKRRISLFTTIKYICFETLIAQFEFNSNSLTTAALQVTDITGMVLFEKKLIPIDGGARDYFDFSGLASGIYLVRLKQDGQQLVERVVVQRK